VSRTDRPDAPTDVRLISCTATAAEVAWHPSRNNNDPIIDYTVYYNSSDNPEEAYHEGPKTPGHKYLIKVPGRYICFDNI